MIIQEESDKSAELSKPYEIIVSILDRPKLGDKLIDFLFINLLLDASERHAATKKSHFSLLIDALEPFFIFKKLFMSIYEGLKVDVRWNFIW